MSNPYEILPPWFQNGWWLDEGYRTAIRELDGPDEFSSRIAAVAKVFNAGWQRERALGHPASFWLFSQGTYSITFLSALGRDLIAVSKCHGFNAVRNGLRDPGHYDSTRLELSIGALLRDAGHDVRFQPSTQQGKLADIAALRNGQEVYFEIKVLREAEAGLISDEFVTWLGMTLDGLIRERSAELNYEVWLTAELSDLFSKKRSEPEFHAALAEQIKAAVAEHLAQHRSEFSLAGVGRFAFRPKDALSNSSIGHFPVAPKVELGRILRGGLHGAMEQLPLDKPGIIVFRTPGQMDCDSAAQEIRSLLATEVARYAHVCGVIILPVVYSSNARWARFEPFLVPNPAAQTLAAELDSVKALMDTCGIIEKS